MKKLLYKEIMLSMHPTNILFLSLSALLVIPNYPYLVTFFYTSLAVFFLCLSGRENHDIFYTVSLPIAKTSFVKARIGFVVLLELAQILMAVPFALLRQNIIKQGNLVGIDANIAFFGFAFMLLGIFNFVFFESYYKKPDGVGAAFAKSSIAITLFIIVVETGVHVIPFMRDKLDTNDPVFLQEKLLVFAAGISIFILLTVAVYLRSKKSFEKLDL